MVDYQVCSATMQRVYYPLHGQLHTKHFLTWSLLNVSSQNGCRDGESVERGLYVPTLLHRQCDPHLHDSKSPPCVANRPNPCPNRIDCPTDRSRRRNGSLAHADQNLRIICDTSPNQLSTCVATITRPKPRRPPSAPYCHESMTCLSRRPWNPVPRHPTGSESHWMKQPPWLLFQRGMRALTAGWSRCPRRPPRCRCRAELTNLSGIGTNSGIDARVSPESESSPSTS